VFSYGVREEGGEKLIKSTISFVIKYVKSRNVHKERYWIKIRREKKMKGEHERELLVVLVRRTFSRHSKKFLLMVDKFYRLTVRQKKLNKQYKN
jgi:hypothetical protein